MLPRHWIGERQLLTLFIWCRRPREQLQTYDPFVVCCSIFFRRFRTGLEAGRRRIDSGSDGSGRVSGVRRLFGHSVVVQRLQLRLLFPAATLAGTFLLRVLCTPHTLHVNSWRKMNHLQLAVAVPLANSCWDAEFSLAATLYYMRCMLSSCVAVGS